LLRNPTYWGKKPKIARVIIQPISNNTARVQALQSGEVNGADLIQPTDIPTIKKNKNLKLLNRPSFNVAYVTINSAHAPFNKLAVASRLRREGQRRDGGRSEPDRLDGRLRGPGQLRRHVLQDVRATVGVPQLGDLQHPRQGGQRDELQEARRPLPEGEHHDHEVPARRSLRPFEAGSRLPEKGEGIHRKPGRNRSIRRGLLRRTIGK